MNFKSIDEAIEQIKKLAPIHAQAYNNADNKKANKLHDQLVEAMEYLMKGNSLFRLNELLDNPDLGIAQWAAIYLLKSETHLAEKKLEEIATKEDSLMSLSAEYALIEWREGKLDLWGK